MDDDLTAAERAVVKRARAFACDVVAPNAAQWEASRTVPRAALAQAAAAGLCGLIVPVELGGLGLGATATARVMQELAAADMAFAFCLVVHNNLAGNIARNGTAAQAQRYLPDMLSGGRIGAFLLTEPKGGSDAAAIETRADREGDDWTLDGEKAWVTNAAVADILSVYAQTDPAAGWRGIACFLVAADAPGVERLAAYQLMGGHAMGTGGFRFTATPVAAEDLLLPAGRAFKAALAGIDLARILVGAMCCGMLQAGLECALDYAVKRRAFGQSTASFQGLQWMLADAATDLEASRLMTYDAARRLDAGADTTVAAAHAKKFASRAAHSRLADCMQAMGAAGFRADYPLARHLAGAKMAQFLDGTTEIQNVVIARSLLRGRD